jgi:preprotein translocase subunit SecG
MLTVFVILQVICALGLMALTAFTTTKSEQGGAGFWGTLGGKASTSIAGLEDQLERVTMYVAVAFLIFSSLVGIVAFKSAS